MQVVVIKARTDMSHSNLRMDRDIWMLDKILADSFQSSGSLHMLFNFLFFRKRNLHFADRKFFQFVENDLNRCYAKALCVLLGSSCERVRKSES